jgi:hypothetical protein
MGGGKMLGLLGASLAIPGGIVLLIIIIVIVVLLMRR